MFTIEQSTYTDPRRPRQYTLGGALKVWAAAALPMAALAWLVAPWLATTLNGPAALPRALIIALTMGLIWQFALVLHLLRREQGSLRWPVVKDALWLHAPRDPRTSRRGGRLWLIVVPLGLALAAKEFLPSVPAPGDRDLGVVFDSDAGRELLSGNWHWFALVATMLIFNTALGEELLFRGWLLPRMQTMFGERGWIANGVLFALYHLHVPWGIPKALLDTLILAYPSQRYRSALVGIIVHSAQSVFFLGLALALTLR